MVKLMERMMVKAMMEMLVMMIVAISTLMYCQCILKRIKIDNVHDNNSDGGNSDKVANDSTYCSS